MLFPEHASHLDIYLIIIFSESLYLTKEPNSAVKLLLISGILYKPIPHLHTPFHPQILFILKFYVNSPYNKSCSCSGQRIPLSPIFLYLFLPVCAISQLGYIWLHSFLAIPHNCCAAKVILHIGSRHLPVSCSASYGIFFTGLGSKWV